jgi:hypothetical protein
MENDEPDKNVEPACVQVARLVGIVGAYQPGEWPHVDPVLVLGDEAESDLDGDRGEEDKYADRAEGIMAYPGPAAPKVAGNCAGASNETRETSRGASDDAPQNPEYEQRQDRAS